MSYISEKVAYLDGLADGKEIGDDKYGKLIRGIIDALGAIAEELEEQNETIDEISECIDEIYEELDDLLDFDDDLGEEGFVELDCPSCEETLYINPDMLDLEDELSCPSCGEEITFDILFEDDEDEDEEDEE